MLARAGADPQAPAGLKGQEEQMRGFLGGVSLGTLIAVAGAAIWSLSAPLPKLVEIGAETAAPDAGALGT